MTRPPARDACPCGRPLPFGQCCGRYLSDFEREPAPDAESLMRSRYSAFVTENAAYLMATWHPSQRRGQLSFEPGVKWLGLEVRDHVLRDDDHAEVEFVARSRQGGRATRLHERSRFVREGGRWYYLDGDMR